MRFILNDETKKNSYGFKIRTEGINVERFSANPVMLDGHNPSNQAVIGRWVNINKDEGGKFSAEPQFDFDDENAKTIAGKVERGYIKGASMGVSFSKKDLKYKNGELILMECEIFEASIVSIPSNSGALRLRMDGEELTNADIEQLCLSLASAKNEDVKTETTKKENMKLQLGQLALLALGFDTQNKELTADEIEQAILKLQTEKNDAMEKLLLSEEKVNAFLQKEKIEQEKRCTDLIDEALKLGKITADKKQSFMDLATQNFELAKSTLEAIPAKKTYGLGVQAPSGTTGVATMADFQKLSLQEQLAFKDANPDAYAQILKTI